MIKEVKDTEQNLNKKIKEEVKIFMDKQDEKERKKNNLIIYRLPETEEDDKEQVKKDRTEILKIFDITTPELRAELEECLKKDRKFFRLGNKKAEEGKYRPLKVVLRDEEMKLDILNGCKNLKNSAYEKISIQTDLTIEEQERNYSLRQELKERKANNEKVCIYRNKIILESEHPGRNGKDKK